MYGKPHTPGDLMAVETFGITQQHHLFAFLRQIIQDIVYLMNHLRMNDLIHLIHFNFVRLLADVFPDSGLVLHFVIMVKTGIAGADV
jgi:hypothetical protein